MSVFRLATLAVVAAAGLAVAAPASASFFGNWSGWQFAHQAKTVTKAPAPASGGTPVPEPGDFALFGIGAVALAIGQHRGRRR